MFLYDEYMKKIFYYIIIFIVLAIIGGIYYFYFYHHKTTVIQPQIKYYTYKNDDLKLSFGYPETFQKIKLTDEDKKDKIIFRAEEINLGALISLRYEERVGILKLAQKGSILDVLKQNFNDQYPKRYPDFKKEREEKITINGTEGADFYFTYLGADQKTRMKQRFVIFTHEYDQKELGEVAFYFSFQSKEQDFEKVNSDFQKIIDSIKFF